MGVLDASDLSRINVDQFYGIEIGEFPARIAETAMWMMDHIMNNRLSLEFGPYYVRIPLQKSPHIVVGNALDMDWANVLAPAECTFLFGNPPFRGHQYRTAEQQADMWRVWGRKGQVNRLDYVTCWFKKAVDYCAGEQGDRDRPRRPPTRSPRASSAVSSGRAFSPRAVDPFCAPDLPVEQRSSRQGGRPLRHRRHDTGRRAASDRTIFEYDHVRGDPHVLEVSRINGYLIDGPQYAVPASSQAAQADVCRCTRAASRRMEPGGENRGWLYPLTSNLILDEANRAELLAREPNAGKWLRPYVGGDELISGDWRWCLWLKDADPAELRASTAIQERLKRVRDGRLESPTPAFRHSRSIRRSSPRTASLTRPILAFPEVSSETREYLPIDFLHPTSSHRTVADHRRRAAALLRHPHIRDAHGLDANRHRTVEEPTIAMHPQSITRFLGPS